MSQEGTTNRELVSLTFRSLDAAFAAGGVGEAVSAIQEAFARRIRACLADLPSPQEAKELPEALQREIRKRQCEAALLRQKREAALHVVPAYDQLLQAYRSYDAEMGSPQRLARVLGISATTVLAGAFLGALVERGLGIPYATMVGVVLGVVAFFSTTLRTLGTSRRMTQIESKHAAAVDKLKGDLTAAFVAVDQRGATGEPEVPAS